MTMEIDTTKPNAARIYDHLLGGSHNYPVDRAAAQHLLAVSPTAGDGALLFRYFLHRAVRTLLQSEYTCYVDLATGLPTEGYIHELVPENVKILYNDIEPETVIYARQIVGDRPNILCMQADLRDIDVILQQAGQFFQGERRVGICLVNVSYFIDDEALARVLRRLYDWSAPGSQLAISGLPHPSNEEYQRVLKFYESVGTKIYPRSPEELLRLATPWQVVGALRPIQTYTQESLHIKSLGDVQLDADIGYGGILSR